MRRRSATLFLLLLMVSLKSAAQTPNNLPHPLDVSVCDLLSQPSKYSGQLVRVRGQISIAFEDFSLSAKDCPRLEEKLGAIGVWLNYGGDESTPTIYCCGDHSRKPGEVIEVQGHRIPLLRDEQFWEFRKRISAWRQARPDGVLCQDVECHFYDVTAILTGHFFAMEQTKDGPTLGYGHMGMFHTLLIEQVTGIDARRTHVPAGGIFDCKSETWVVPSSEAKDILSDYENCHDRKSCGDALQHALIMGAKHWGEPLKQVELWSEGLRDEAEHYWSSPDLLTTLDFKFPYTNPHIKRSRSEFSVTRTICSPITKPLPQSAKVSCDTKEWELPDSESIAKGLQKDVDRGADVWRLDFKEVARKAVQDFAAKNSIPLSSDLAVESCQANSFKEDEYAYCGWIGRDGMQTASVSLIRYGKLISSDRPKERTVWVQHTGSFSSCKAE